MSTPHIDTFHMGRSSIDLYSADVGSPFPDIERFAAYVGGSPTNISVGARRLGLASALLTGVGQDPVGDFVLAFLEREGVITEYIPRKPANRTSAVVLGVEPPDRFPLVFYRENCADSALSIDDVLAAPIASAQVFQFAGTNLSREPSRSATIFAAEVAKQAGKDVVFDVDFRPDQWDDPRAFGVAVRSCMRLVDVVVGTEDEINAAVLSDASQVDVTHSQISDARVAGDVSAAIGSLMALGPKAVVEKIGAEGARVHVAGDGASAGEVIDAPGFPVEITNILGAGDAFGAGFIYGYVKGWSWRDAARLGNACGAIVVTEHGCANFMPTYDQVMAFVDARGGL